MFCAKNIERIGDHATNIAETVFYMIEGQQILDKRPKGYMTTLRPRSGNRPRCGRCPALNNGMGAGFLIGACQLIVSKSFTSKLFVLKSLCSVGHV